jgi:hypothetical protein
MTGKPQTVEYRAWRGMKTRCTNPNRPDWKNYGGRGITVCDRWVNSFETFLADMGPKPSGSTRLTALTMMRGMARKTAVGRRGISRAETSARDRSHRAV